MYDNHLMCLVSCKCEDAAGFLLFIYLSIYLGNINLNLYTYIIYIFMYIYTVEYSSRNTHEPGERDERSIMVKGQGTQIYTATIHYITTQYATGAMAQYSNMTSLLNNLPATTL